jgi:hypothetical protein
VSVGIDFVRIVDVGAMRYIAGGIALSVWVEMDEFLEGHDNL